MSAPDLPFECSPRRGGRRVRGVDVEVEVWVRARPLTKGEIAVDRHRKGRNGVGVRMYSDVHRGCLTVMNPVARNIAASYRSYCFDRCAWGSKAPSCTGAEYTDQASFYSPLEPLVEQVLHGFNQTVISYGQIGSGKSYTMFGKRSKAEEGLIPRAGGSLLQSMLAYNGAHKVRYFTLKVAAISVYRNEAYDLLRDDNITASPGKKAHNIMPVHVTSHVSLATGTDEKQVHVPGLRYHTVYSSDDIEHYLHVASVRRKPNSHCIVLYKVLKAYGAAPDEVLDEGLEHNKTERKSCSMLTMVDLAGTEDLRKLDPEAVSTADVVANNKSLSVLRIAFERLAAHGTDLAPPLRESVLTKILAASIGGNTRTLLVAHVSPHATCYQESYNTLRFADAVKAVQSHVSFAAPSPPCDDRINELRRLLDDPYLTQRQRSLLGALLEDELDEVGQYDSWLRTVVDRRRELLSVRYLQQEVVNKYNAITAKASKEATTADAELQEAQHAMKRLMDRLQQIEARSGGKYSAQLEGEKQLLREQLQKAANEKLMLNNLKSRLLRKLDNLTFDTLLHGHGREHDHEPEYEEDEHDELPLPLPPPSVDDTISEATRRVVDPADPHEPQEHVSDNTSGADEADICDDLEHTRPVISQWLSTLEALSSQVSCVLDSGNIPEARDLAACVREMGAAHPKFHGIMKALGDRLDNLCSAPDAVPDSGRLGAADLLVGDPFDGTQEMNTAAVRVGQLVEELAVTEASAAKHFKHISMLEGRVEELNNNCHKLVSAIREARRHDLHPAAAASLAVGLAEIDYNAFTTKEADPSLSVTTAVRTLLQPEEYSDNATHVSAFKSAVSSLLASDAALNVLPPPMRSQVAVLGTMMEKIDISGDHLEGQLAILRSELLVQKKDATTMCDVQISLVPQEASRAAPQAGTASQDLAIATAKAAQVAATLRRDEQAEAKIREVAGMFLSCNASEAASLADESRRRAALGDHVGAAAALHAAAAAAAADMTIYSSPAAPNRLGGLLNGLSELQKALSRGDLVSLSTVEELRDQACSLSGLGPGTAECMAGKLHSSCLTQDVGLVASSAASASRRHPGIGNYLRDIVALLHESESRRASAEAEKACEALRATRMAVVEIDEVVKSLGIKAEADAARDVQRAAAAATTAAQLLGSSPAGTLVGTAASGLNTALLHFRNGERSKAVEVARTAAAAVTKAATTGVASAVQLARKFAAACAELRGKAASTITSEGIQQLAHDALALSQEVSYAANASHPSAVVTGGLHECTQKLLEAAEHLSSGKVCRESCEAIGKAGAAVWGAAEGHSNIVKALSATKNASGHYANGCLEPAQAALTEATEAMQQAGNAITCNVVTAQVQSITRQTKALLREPCGNTSAAEAHRICKLLGPMAGEHGADENTARFIAERLNEVLRGLHSSCSNAELASVVTSTMAHAAERACVPTPDEVSANALREKLERSLEPQGEDANLKELISTARHLAEVQGGLVGSSMDRVVAELAGGAPTEEALEICTKALSANTALKEAANTLQQQLASGEYNVNELVVLSGEMALAAGTLEGDAKEQLYALSEALTQASRAPDAGVVEQVVADIQTVLRGPEPVQQPNVADVAAAFESILESITTEGVRGEAAQGLFGKLQQMKELCPGTELLFSAIDAYIAKEAEAAEECLGEGVRSEAVLDQETGHLQQVDLISHAMHAKSLQQLLAGGVGVDDVLAKAAELLPEGSAVAVALADAPRDIEEVASVLQAWAASSGARPEELQAEHALNDSTAMGARSSEQVAVADILARATENREHTTASLEKLKEEIDQAGAMLDEGTRLADTLKNLASDKENNTLSAADLRKAAVLARAAAAKNAKLKSVATKLEELAQRAEDDDSVQAEELEALAAEAQHESRDVLEELSDLLCDKVANKAAILELLPHVGEARAELIGLLRALEEYVTQPCPHPTGASLTDILSHASRSQSSGVPDLSSPEAVAQFVERLRNGEDLTEQAKLAVGRLRSSSTKMVGLADDAEQCLMQGDLKELANVLGRAMVAETFSPDDLVIPQVAPKYTSLCAAVKELRNKYARGVPIPSTYVADIREKAAIIGDIGCGCVENICASIDEVPPTTGGAFALKAASKRHNVVQLATAAELLQEGNVHQALQSCEALSEGLAAGREALAHVITTRWDIACEAGSDTGPAEQAIDIAASKLAVCGVDTSSFTTAKEHLEAAAGFLSNDKSHDAVQCAQKSVDVLNSAVHCDPGHSQQVAVGISRALTELSKAMASDFADKGVISEQLTFLRREVTSLLECTPSMSVLHKSLTRVATDLAQVKVNAASAQGDCQKIASRLRNSVDAQVSVSKASQILSSTVKVFLSGRTDEGLVSVGQAAMVCECLRTYSLDTLEDLREVAAASPDTPSMILAATVDHIATQLSHLGGASSNEGHAACLAVSRFTDIESLPIEERVPVLDKLLTDMLLISGMPASAGELGAKALSDKLYMLEQSSDSLASAELREELKEGLQGLASCSGVVGDAVDEVTAMLDAADPDTRVVVDGIVDCVGRLRDVANRLWVAEARGSISADELGLLGGCALSAVGYAPGSSGKCGVELAERLGEAASRKGRGLGVNIESLREAAAEAAGLAGAKPTEVHEMRATELQVLTAKAKKLMVEGCATDLTETAAVLEAAAAGGDLTGKTLAAVAKVASLGSHVMLESLSLKIDAATKPFDMLSVAALLDDLEAHISENPKLRGLLASAEAQLQSLLVPKPILAHTVAKVVEHPQLDAGLRGRLLEASDAVGDHVVKLSDACAAALQTSCSERAKDALRLVLSTVDSQGCTEAVLLAAEEALREGCAAPLVSTTLEALRSAHLSLAQVASQGAKDATNPSEARYAMYNAAVAALVSQNKDGLSRDLLELNGAEMCCVLRTKVASGDIANADLVQLLDDCEVSDLPALQEAHQQVSSMEELIASLRRELQERASAHEVAEHETEQLKGELGITQSQLAVIEEQLQKAEQYSDEREGRIVSLEDACSLLEGQLQQVETEGRGSTQHIKEIQASLDASQSAVERKEQEVQGLRDSIEAMQRDFEATLETDRTAMQKAVEDAATAANVREVLQGAVDENVSDVAKRTLRAIEETSLLPTHLQETVQHLLDHGGDLTTQCEALEAAQAAGIELPKNVVTMIDAAQGTEIHSAGLGTVASSMETLADRIRRGSSIKVDSVREVSQQLRADGAMSSAALVDEATRRLQAGDSVGASLVLQTAADGAATVSAHGVPIHPRLAGLLADLEELHHRLSSGQRVTKAEVSKLRGRAMETAALGSSATEACLRYLAKKASAAPKSALPHIAEVAQGCIQRHPEATELFHEFSQSVVTSPLVAGALLTEAADTHEEMRLAAVQTGELTRRLQLGETGGGIQAAAAHTAGVVSGIIEGARCQSDPLKAALAGVRRAVDKLSASTPSTPSATVEMSEAAQQIELAAGCGLLCAVTISRRAAAFARDLVGKVTTGAVPATCVELTVDALKAELSSAALAVPSRSIISVAASDSAALLSECATGKLAETLQKVADLLSNASDAQETVERCLGNVVSATELLDKCGGAAGGANQQSLKKAADAMRLAGDAAAAAKTACSAGPFTGICATLLKAADDFRGIADRCAASEIDSSTPPPSATDVRAAGSHLSKLGGRVGGDEAASRLIAERLRGILETLQKKGEVPVEMAETLHAFPAPVYVAAAEKETADVGPSAGEAAAAALSVQLRKIEEALAMGMTLQDSAEDVRTAARDAQKAQEGESIVARAMVAVESLIHDAIEKQVPDAVMASIQGAKELCDGAANASKSARYVARSLWGLESCTSYGIQPSRKDLVSLSEEAAHGAACVDSDVASGLVDVAASLQALAGTLNVDIAELGRLRDAAATAAGLPVRSAGGTIADLASRTLALSTRVAAGGFVDPTELARLCDEAKAAATRHPEASSSLLQLSEELRDASTKAHDRESDLALGASYDRAKRLEESFSGPTKVDVCVQWPDAEGFLSDEESVQKMRATLGKQMQEEMSKLNAKWKKKVGESERVRDELAAELAEMAEQLAEAEMEMEALMQRNGQLEDEVTAMQRDAMEGVEEIIADKDESLRLHAEALDSASRLKLEDHESIERLELEVATESHLARLVALMNDRSIENWMAMAGAFTEGASTWEGEEDRLNKLLHEAGGACSSLEGAVTRIEQDKERLAVEMGLVEQEIQSERRRHEAELKNLELRIEQQNDEICELENALAENDTAEAMKTGMEAALRGEVEKHKELCTELNTRIADYEERVVELEDEACKAKHDAKGGSVKVETLVAELEDLERKRDEVTALNETLQFELKECKQLNAALSGEVEAAAMSTNADGIGSLQKELAKMSAEREKAQQEHTRLENEAAEALVSSEERNQQLEKDLNEAQQMIEELSEALEVLEDA